MQCYDRRRCEQLPPSTSNSEIWLLFVILLLSSSLVDAKGFAVLHSDKGARRHPVSGYRSTDNTYIKKSLQDNSI
jgi:hypothetical protein